MSEQTQSPVSEGEKRLWTILLSLITAAVLGQFGFSWNMNRDFGAMQERDRIRTQSETEWKNDLKEMKIDVNELKGKMIKMEGNVDQLQRFK